MGFTLAEAFIRLSVKRESVKPSIAAAVQDAKRWPDSMRKALNEVDENVKRTGLGMQIQLTRGAKGGVAAIKALGAAAPALAGALGETSAAVSGLSGVVGAMSFGPVAVGVGIATALAAAFASSRREGESFGETLQRLTGFADETRHAMTELAKQRGDLAGDLGKLNNPVVGTSKTDALREMQAKAREQATKARELLEQRLRPARLGGDEFGRADPTEFDKQQIAAARAAVREANALLQKINAQLAETTAREVRKRQRELFGGSPANIGKALLGITFGATGVGGGKMTDPALLERNRAAIKGLFGADPGSDEYKKKAQEFRNDEMKRKARESREHYSFFDATGGGRGGGAGGEGPKQQRFAVDQLARSIESTLGRQKDRNLQVAEASDQKLAKINLNMEALVASSRGSRYAVVAPA